MKTLSQMNKLLPLPQYCLTRAVGGQHARLYAPYSHKALFHYIALNEVLLNHKHKYESPIAQILIEKN